MRIIVIFALCVWMLWGCFEQNHTQYELDAANCALDSLAYFDTLDVELMDSCYTRRGLTPPWYEQ